MSGRQEPVAQPPIPIDLDGFISVVKKTILSPLVTLFVPLTLLGQGIRTDSKVFIWSCVYSGVICLAGSVSHISHAYENRGSLFSPPKKINLTDQIVLITGGASGIGALLAEALAKRNVTVVVLDIKGMETHSGSIKGYICDVSDYSQVRDTAKKIRDEIGDPTVIINNAGIVSGKLILDLEESDITRTFGVNVLSHFWTIKTFLPAMIRKGAGHIITVGSVLGIVGSAQMTDYCASKAALINMHSSLQFELNSRYAAPGVHTTLLLPGHIRTPLFSKVQLPKSPFFQFFAPSLQPQTVVDEIISAIEAQENRVVRIPFYTQSARLLGLGAGLVPAWLRDFLQWMSNADFSMEFYGPQGGDRQLCER